MPPKRSCGNELFLSWVEEEKQKLSDKGVKSADTWGKAAKSIAACPVTYEHPSELVALRGVGPKIVDFLTKKLRIHCDENGLEEPETPRKNKGKAKATAKGKGKAKARSVSPEGDDSPSKTPAAAPKAKAPAKKLSYIPKPRTGGYGLLLALLLAIDDPTRTTTVFLTKVELIPRAQPYCDESYMAPHKGMMFTAWNNMRTLVEKGYVYSNGNPKKYCLTEEGYGVAMTIRKMLPQFAHLGDHPFLHGSYQTATLSASMVEPSRPRVAPLPIPLSRSDAHRPNVPQSRPAEESRRVSNPDRFQFWYIDGTGTRVHSLSSAMVRLDPDDFVNIRKLEFRYSQRNHPITRQLKLVDTAARIRDQTDQPTLYGYMVEDVAPPLCSKFADVPVAAPSSQEVGGSGGRKRQRSISLDDLEVEDTPAGRAGRPPPKKTPDQLFAEIGGGVGGSSTSFARTVSAPVALPQAGRASTNSTSALAAEAAARRLGLGTTASMSSIPFVGGPKPVRPAPRLSSHVPIHNPLADTDDSPTPPTNLPNFDPSTAIIFPAGSYEIVLLIDQREVESTTSRNKFEDELQAKGIRCETRTLVLGDFIWIARRLDGMGGADDEVVLDYVVERKRLDDLCTSIKDGRYNEQCHRLQSSATQNIYYVVEDFQVTERMEVNGLQIRTAKSQIQVHNRFFLKETHKLSETIDFLKTMTEVIISLHAHTDLHIIPSRYLSRSTFSALQNHLRSNPSVSAAGQANKEQRSYLVSWSDHKELNAKTASQTLANKFAEMMLCIKGMSQEKVSALLDVWDTPRALWEDLKVHAAAPVQQEEEQTQEGGKKKKVKVRGKDMFFADRVPGEGRRKINDGLSRDMYRILMTGGDGDD